MRTPWLDALRESVASLRSGSPNISGIGSPLSLSTNGGVLGVPQPIALSFTREDGQTVYVTAEARMWALSGAGAGAGPMLTLFSDLSAVRLLSAVHRVSGAPGPADAIRFGLSTPLHGSLPSTTSPSTSPKTLNAGISGVPCDECGGAIHGAYAQLTVPPDGTRVFHPGCLERRFQGLPPYLEVDE